MFYAALVAVFLAFFAPAEAHAGSMFDLPNGHWELRPGIPELCLDVLPDHKLRLTFQGPMDRNPLVIDGSYETTATKMGDYHFRFKISVMHQKTLSKCRKYWIDEEVPETTRLDTKMQPGTVLKMTAKFECAHNHPSVQLCLHDAGKDGKQVLCKTLADTEKSCKAPPPIDGALINAPPHRSPNAADESAH